MEIILSSNIISLARYSISETLLFSLQFFFLSNIFMCKLVYISIFRIDSAQILIFFKKNQVFRLGPSD